jgi:uncharacterized membrane protein
MKIKEVDVMELGIILIALGIIFLLRSKGDGGKKE